MKKAIILLGISALFFNSCALKTMAYLRYDWNPLDVPISFTDTNPSTPSTLYPDKNFSTNSGSFRVDYEASDHSVWYLNYTITKDDSSIFFKGEDSWFKIKLTKFGASLTQYAQDTSTFVGNLAPTNLKEPIIMKTIYSSQISLEGLTEGPVLGRESLTAPEGSISIEFGKWIQK